MKTFLILALFIAISNAVQVQRVQGGQNTVPNVCSCDDQYKGIIEYKNFATQCFDQCRVTPSAVVRSIIDIPVKINPCVDIKVHMIHRVVDCVNAKIMQIGSCVSDPSVVEQGVQGVQGVSPVVDFRQVIIRYLSPVFDQIENVMQIIDQTIIPNIIGVGNVGVGNVGIGNVGVGKNVGIGNIGISQNIAQEVLGIGDCVSDCFINKIRQAPYFDQVNCVPKIGESQIQQVIQQCVRDVNVKQTIIKVCQCVVGVGGNEIQQVCQQLPHVNFPGIISGIVGVGGVGVGNVGVGGIDQVIGGQSSIVHPRGQKMVVKMIIDSQDVVSGIDQGIQQGIQGIQDIGVNEDVVGGVGVGGVGVGGVGGVRGVGSGVVNGYRQVPIGSVGNVGIQ